MIKFYIDNQNDVLVTEASYKVTSQDVLAHIKAIA
jgi:hypothetical protein